MWIENGGRVINLLTSINKAPINDAAGNAVGDGVHDDTASFKAAYNYVLNVLSRYTRNNDLTSFIIWGPGNVGSPRTYLITDEIIYDGTTDEGENLQYLRFIGEDRRYCTIRVANGAFGSTEKHALRMLKNSSDINALETKSCVMGWTIDVGKNNPGAVGLGLAGANGNVISDLTIRSGDGQGKYGIRIFGISQYYGSDITIEGFDEAIWATYKRSTYNAFENITIRNQNTSGIRVDNAGFSLRKILSQNSVEALKLTAGGGFFCVTDSRFEGGAAGKGAIQLNAGNMFARGVVTQGYGAAIKQNSTVLLAGSNIVEYSGTPILTLWSRNSSIPLEAEDMPVIEWPADSDWEVVTADGQAAAQAAMNSGKPGVMFKRFTHNIGTVDVPASVKYIYGAYSAISGAFRLSQDSTDPLMLHAINDASVQQNKRTRTVVMQEGASFDYRTSSPAASDKVFLTALSGLGAYTLSTATIFARMINTEPKGAPAAFSWEAGATVWIFGYKTETADHSQQVLNGAKVEILGGLSNQTPFTGTAQDPENPNSAILNAVNSQISMSCMTTGFDDNTDGYCWGVKNQRSAVNRSFEYKDLPTRPVGVRNMFMPIYADLNQ
ncbi:MAG: hypothetical protein U1E42_01145 [Rhodospirillales bacterium]